MPKSKKRGEIEKGGEEEVSNLYPKSEGVSRKVQRQTYDLAGTVVPTYWTVTEREKERRMGIHNSPTMEHYLP